MRPRPVLSTVLLACALLPGCAADPPTPAGPAPLEVIPAGPVPQQRPVDSVTVVAGGDVLIHPALTEQAGRDGGGTPDFAPLLAGIKPVVEQAHLAVCHLEVPIDAGPPRGYPKFNAPVELAAALAETGFDTCSTASNHTLDQGPEGVVSTLDALDAAGVGHTGSARSAKEAATPLVREVAGVKVAQLSYTFGFNKGTSRPSGTPWLANLLDPETVLADAREARAAGAEIVIASLHWGTEGKHDPTASQQRIAAQLLADPALDLIIGHHAHVVQPFEKINGKWVAYGLGNLVARHEQPSGPTEEGALARFRFVRGGSGWTVEQAEYVPTLIDLGASVRVRDLSGEGADPERRDEALRRTDEAVLSRDAAAAGLTRPGG